MRRHAAFDVPATILIVLVVVPAIYAASSISCYPGSVVSSGNCVHKCSESNNNEVQSCTDYQQLLPPPLEDGKYFDFVDEQIKDCMDFPTATMVCGISNVLVKMDEVEVDVASMPSQTQMI